MPTVQLWDLYVIGLPLHQGAKAHSTIMAAPERGTGTFMDLECV